jgi:lysozyme family protein
VPLFEAEHLQACPPEIGLQDQTVMSRTEYDAVVRHLLKRALEREPVYRMIAADTAIPLVFLVNANDFSEAVPETPLVAESTLVLLGTI